jgi:hypothetical protein
MASRKIIRKKFSVRNRDKRELNDNAIEKVIERYEKKTGRFVAKEGRSCGNNFFYWDCYVWSCRNEESLKEISERFV